MEKEILKMIQKEDRHKPFTDEEIAKGLQTARETVTNIRAEHGIPNSRERLQEVLYKDALRIYQNDPTLSHRSLLKELKDLGYAISRNKALSLLNQIKETEESKAAHKDEVVEKPLEEPVEEEGPFSKIIGHNESMKLQIRQAQASVLYPPKGLHTLVLGPSGVGKSYLAQLMHEYAVTTGNFDDDAPFVAFNCADYADNPQLLLAQLFGYVKGAFTGADKDKAGLVEKANNGILFLDEIHRLPGEGQEILFNILDKGMFRKLGETENYTKVNVLIIAATTEKTESSMLLTFRRRIPMVIDIPPLSERTKPERFKIVQTFFREEANRIQKNIVVDVDAQKALMLYHCPGNVGQLRSDIQVGCARALLNTLLEKSDLIRIKLSDLANHVRIGLLDIDRKDDQIEAIVTEDLIINVLDTPLSADETNQYVMPNKIYQFIESRSSDLENQGLKLQEINQIISNEMETKLNQS